jgi:hypothetical protein
MSESCDKIDPQNESMPGKEEWNTESKREIRILYMLQSIHKNRMIGEFKEIVYFFNKCFLIVGMKRMIDSDAH